ncbi:MAG TPA: hypothetical protein VFZ16_14675 [Hyphomicrobiaceae bacterium]|nr:hypothetical protein [Hyphomicrobiaceae bacterium]
MSGLYDVMRENWTFLMPGEGYPSGVSRCVEHFVHHFDPAELAGRQYTFAQVASMLGKEGVDEDVVLASNYLVSSGIFDVVYLFVDEDGALNEVFRPAEIIEARKHNCLPHPRTGDCVPEFERRLIPVFVFTSAH